MIVVLTIESYKESDQVYTVKVEFIDWFFNSLEKHNGRVYPKWYQERRQAYSVDIYVCVLLATQCR